MQSPSPNSYASPLLKTRAATVSRCDDGASGARRHRTAAGAGDHNTGPAGAERAKAAGNVGKPDTEYGTATAADRRFRRRDRPQRLGDGREARREVQGGETGAVYRRY